MDRQQIYSGVRGVLVDSLGVLPDDVREDSELQLNLGAESIDYLDIVYRLEKGFDIKIAKTELFPHVDLNDLVGDRVTQRGIQSLMQTAPHIDLDRLGDRPKLGDVESRIHSVRSILNYLEMRLNEPAYSI